MMPFQDVNPDTINPPAIVRPAEDLSGFSITRDFNRNLPQVERAVSEDNKQSATLQTGERQISNRPSNAEYKVIYVNGIRTSEDDAKRSANLVRGSLGVEDNECKVVYNQREHSFKAGLKILGGTISTKLGEKAESGCVGELQEIISATLHAPGNRLTIVGHSQGSLVIQNAFDRAYDDFKRSPETRRLWEQASPRIEVIMYAPLVRTLAPGPQAVALLNGLDLPARGLGIAQRAVASSKHYLGYRQQQAVRTIVYHPDTNEFPRVLFNPQSVHESFQLILDNPEFNFRLLAEDPKTKAPDVVLFSNNLYASIRDGKRADILHFELIRLGCDTFGRDFARPFIGMCTVQENGEIICIDNFKVEGPRLEYLRGSGE
jgi:hypothetical protein